MYNNPIDRTYNTDFCVSQMHLLRHSKLAYPPRRARYRHRVPYAEDPVRPAMRRTKPAGAGLSARHAAGIGQCIWQPTGLAEPSGRGAAVAGAPDAAVFRPLGRGVATIG